MSSVVRAASEIPQRIGFLLVESNILTADVRVPANGVSAVMSSSAFTAATSAGTQINAGALLRDMGKEVHIVDGITGMASAVYRLVMPLSGAATEGANLAVATAFVKVWDAASSGVQVSRTG